MHTLYTPATLGVDQTKSMHMCAMQRVYECSLATLFIIAKTQKQPKYPSLIERINKFAIFTQ